MLTYHQIIPLAARDWRNHCHLSPKQMHSTPCCLLVRRPTAKNSIFLEIILIIKDFGCDRGVNFGAILGPANSSTLFLPLNPKKRGRGLPSEVFLLI